MSFLSKENLRDETKDQAMISEIKLPAFICIFRQNWWKLLYWFYLFRQNFNAVVQPKSLMKFNGFVSNFISVGRRNIWKPKESTWDTKEAIQMFTAAANGFYCFQMSVYNIS
jgi:hypothetical protein